MKIKYLFASLILSYGLTAQSQELLPDSNQDTKDVLNSLYTGVGEDIYKVISISNNLELIIMNDGKRLIHDKESGLVLHSLNKEKMVTAYKSVNGGAFNVFSDTLIDINKDIIANDLTSPIVYKAENEVAEIHVFIEPTCGYCYKMHKNLNAYTDKGITVKYYPLPLYGDDSFNIYASIWSIESEIEQKLVLDRTLDKIFSKPRPESLSLSTLGLPAITSKGQEIVQKDSLAGKRLGIQGTPSLALNNGFVMSGAADPEAILKALGITN